MHEYLVDDSLDFSATDARFAEVLSGAEWLGQDRAQLARNGLRELLVNIRTHAYGVGRGPIEVTATTTPESVTVTATDWGAALPDVQPAPPVDASDAVGRGLATIDRAFHEVIYRRVKGTNRWVLRLFAGQPHTAS